VKRLNRNLRNQLKSQIHGLFVLGQRLGWDVLPRHFYSSIPDIQELKNSEAWRRPSSMAGIDGVAIDSQLKFLRECCLPLQERLRRGAIHEHACVKNGTLGYGPTEADFLFCFVMNKRPKKIVQVGCGVSTAVILLAAKEANYQPHTVCIEPFPSRYLKDLSERGVIELITKRAQDVDIDVFTDVGSGDLVFIDSTHTVKAGSEVNRMVLEVLPRIKPGCFVHFHDIYFPYDYQSSLFTTLFFSSESTLLHAFLIHNSRYAVAVSLSMLHHECPQEMQLVLPNYRPAAMHDGLHAYAEADHFPSATYLIAK
jgi:hypothetical protein